MFRVWEKLQTSLFPEPRLIPSRRDRELDHAKKPS